MKKFILAAFAALLLTGCGLSDFVSDSGKRLDKLVSSTKSQLDAKEKSFKSSELAKSLSTYVEKENLNKSFVDAKTELQRTSQTLKSLKKLIEDDDSDKETIAISRINNINTNIRAIKVMMNAPQKRLEELQATLKNADSIEKKAKDSNEYTVKKVLKVVSYIQDQLATNENTSGKVNDLNSEINDTMKIADDSVKAYKVLSSEYKKSNSMDISNFLNQSKLIATKKVEIDKKQKRIHKKIGELNSSYTKILSDMKEDFYIVVGATSWDEYYDNPTEHNIVLRKSKVTRELYERLANNTGTIATYSKGSLFGGGLNLKSISQRDWNLLRINNSQLLARGDDSSEVYIQDAPVETFHKYVIVKNGKKEETNWIKVSEAIYEQHFNDLGMSIVSKPYGTYESDTLRRAVPAGMEFVGNKKYGKWEEEKDSSGHSTGNSFWHYYGMYSFFTGGNNHYYRSDYNNYRSYRSSSPRSSYYGRNKSYGTFGSRSFTRRAGTTSRMRTSMKRGTTSRTRSRTIRSSGRSSRGRGPGGGGK